MVETLTGKIWETQHGWAYAVYTGDGTIPGSLKGAAGAYATPGEASGDMVKDLLRAREMLDCEHEYDERQICIHCRRWDFENV